MAITDSIYYIRGEINSWGVDSNYRFKTDGTVHFIENVTLVGEFKISDENWGNNYGADSSNKDLEKYITPETTSFNVDGVQGGANFSFTNPHTFSKITLNKWGGIIFTLSQDTVTYPEHLYIYNTTTGSVFREMTKLQEGVFVFSSKFTAGDYKFISEQTNINEGTYTNDGLVSSTTSPFYEKYDLIEDGAANTPFTIAEGKYRFKVDLINNIFEITDISNAQSTSAVGYPYLVDVSGNKTYFKNEGDSFFSLEDINLSGNRNIYTYSEDSGYVYFDVGNEDTTIIPNTKYSLTKNQYGANINFQNKIYKRLEVYLGSSAYLILYEYEEGDIIPEKWYFVTEENSTEFTFDENENKYIAENLPNNVVGKIQNAIGSIIYRAEEADISVTSGNSIYLNTSGTYDFSISNHTGKVKFYPESGTERALFECEVAALPDKLYWHNNSTNEAYEMIKESTGIFTYSSTYQGEYTFDFLTLTSSYVIIDRYRKGALIEETTSPFYQKYNISKNGSDFFVINGNNEIFNFRVDLNTNIVEITKQESSTPIVTWWLAAFNPDNYTISPIVNFQTVNGETYLENVSLSENFNLCGISEDGTAYMYGASDIIDVTEFTESMVVRGLNMLNSVNSFQCGSNATFKKITLNFSTSKNEYGLPAEVDIIFEVNGTTPAPSTEGKVFFGTTEIQSIYLGSTKVNKIYLGSSLLFNDETSIT